MTRPISDALRRRLYVVFDDFKLADYARLPLNNPETTMTPIDHVLMTNQADAAQNGVYAAATPEPLLTRTQVEWLQYLVANGRTPGWHMPKRGRGKALGPKKARRLHTLGFVDEVYEPRGSFDPLGFPYYAITQAGRRALRAYTDVDGLFDHGVLDDAVVLGAALAALRDLNRAYHEKPVTPSIAREVAPVEVLAAWDAVRTVLAKGGVALDSPDKNLAIRAARGAQQATNG